MDLKLDPITHDLVIDRDAQLTTGLEAVLQRIRFRLRLFKGELFYNLRKGVPYFDEIIGKPFNEQRTRAVFRKVLAETRGVSQILEFGVTFEHRTVTVAFKVVTPYGVTSGVV